MAALALGILCFLLPQINFAFSEGVWAPKNPWKPALTSPNDGEEIATFPATGQIEAAADKEIQQFYQSRHPSLTKPLEKRLVLIAQQFMGKPYELGALGEGINGYFDQYPAYRLDAFDCETYVDTILALTFGHDLTSFKQYMRQIRYEAGQVDFIKRNHFISLDWNKQNQKQGFIRDITTEIVEQSQNNTVMNKTYQPLTARALIDKAQWYQHIASKRVRLCHRDPQEINRRINQLKQQGARCAPAYADIVYIPFKMLFDKHQKPNQTLFARIPQGAILEIVRPNWDLTPQIGTHLNVSHLGIMLRENNQLYFLQASSITQQVTKSPLIDYLRTAQQSPTIKGINLKRALPQSVDINGKQTKH